MNSKEFLYSIIRLWRYLNIYFLKPFDAVNDALTSTILHKLNWTDEYVEIGSGDGMFSFIMHGGTFPLSFDRYLLADTKLNEDIYDHHKENILSVNTMPSKPKLTQCLDAKLSHIKKVKEIDYAENASVISYEKLPIPDNSINSIFCYTPHGLKDHRDSIREISRVLVRNGSLIILVYNDEFKRDFICYRIGKRFHNKFGQYFENLDAGRYKEITAMSRSNSEWELLFKECDLTIEQVQSGLSGFAWGIYDIQTRPILKPLINIFGRLPINIRTTLKLIWMIILYPLLFLFYLFASNRFFKLGQYDCYMAYQLKKM